MWGLDPEQGDASLQFARAAGEYRVTYPARVETVTFMANATLPPHVRIGRHRVLLDPGLVEIINGDNPFPEIEPVRAFGAEGRELYPLHSGSDFETGMQSYWFWGEIASVEVDVAGESMEVVEAFDIEGPPTP